MMKTAATELTSERVKTDLPDFNGFLQGWTSLDISVPRPSRCQALLV